ncbi:hypothetical protein [Fictibacillus sp. KU28468]|uniref:hypothetical protein n=1 Tax=Fictibacillus sp. KU28468 TaxID=2991053 RepID=UPI00223CCF92|nr:hypothetical protein [Fictibacillus sp. KU28468]UZJ78602.1 hypothetical protein OKX00_21195 [Fictibacillus sp. KU28468]
MTKDAANLIGWEFPSTGGGREDGLNDSGISFFRANPIKSMTREVIQDALDAQYKKGVPVIVKFEEKKIEADKIPGIDELRTIFEKAENHFSSNNNETHKFFKKACEIVNADFISICAIRDRNTSGLTKIMSKEDSHFHRLTKTTGDTGKTGTSNGSYGIGKHAPFATSFLRTMFYGTLNREKPYNIGFQGVIKIASFNRGEEYPTQGTGFYGIKHGHKPLTDITEFDDFFKRSAGDYGTDKFIVGFDDYEGFQNSVIEESVNSYMYAILDGRLEIIIGDVHITKTTLNSVIELIKEFNPDSKVPEFYLTLTSPYRIERTGEFLTEDGHIETVKLYLLEGENFHNKISLNRGTGMKIDEKGNFRTPLKFAGTLIVEGEKLNKVFRLMEPPTHDAWIPGLYQANPKYAEKLRKTLNDWMNRVVRDIAPKFEDDSFELPGLENILPSLSQDECPIDNISVDGEKEKIRSLVIVNNSMTPSAKKKRAKERKKRTQPLDKRKTPKPKNHENKADIKSIRAFCCNPNDGMYKILLTPAQSGDLSLKINLVGESVVDTASIISATNKKFGNAVDIDEKNVLGPITVEKGVQCELLLKLDNLTRYSLGVEQV